MTLWAADRHWPSMIATTATVTALIAWLGIYLTRAKSINSRQTHAALTKVVPSDARELQWCWDKLLVPRVALQTVAITGLVVALAWP